MLEGRLDPPEKTQHTTISTTWWRTWRNIYHVPVAMMDCASYASCGDFFCRRPAPACMQSCIGSRTHQTLERFRLCNTQESRPLLLMLALQKPAHRRKSGKHDQCNATRRQASQGQGSSPLHASGRGRHVFTFAHSWVPTRGTRASEERCPPRLATSGASHLFYMKTAWPCETGRESAGRTDRTQRERA